MKPAGTLTAGIQVWAARSVLVGNVNTGRHLPASNSAREGAGTWVVGKTSALAPAAAMQLTTSRWNFSRAA